MLVGALTASGVDAAEIKVAAVADAQLAILQRQARLWEARTGHRVDIIKMSNSSSNNFVQYITWLSAKNSDVDVYKMDNPWIGQFAHHLVDLAPYLIEHRAMMPHVLDAYTDTEGRVLGLPYTVGTPLLYYRADLLAKYDRPVPKTWRQLSRSAQRIMRAERAAGRRDMWGFVWQGAAYEGLTANALEWIHANGGGTIVEKDGRISINNPRAVDALALAASWIGTISPPGQLTYKEEDARAVFQLGNAVFMRNWPYAYDLLQNEAGSQVRGSVGIAPLPAGEHGDSTAVMGGLGYSVSRYSKHQQAAIDFVLFLTSRDMQRISAKAGLPPTYVGLYSDAEIVQAFPLLPQLEKIARNVLARPSIQTGIRYPEVSTEFWTAVQHALSGKKSPAEALADLEKTLKRVRGRGWRY
ncbi:MAG: ABC transporter substrate-binding protein [Sphingomonadales bacterium]